MWVIVLGNPFDGLMLFGPFTDKDEALRWGEERNGGDWWLEEIQPLSEAP